MQSATTLEISRVTELLEQGQSVKAISNELNTPMAKTKQFIRDNNLVDLLQDKSYWPWDDAEDDQLKEEVNQGIPLEQIAGLHLRTESAIRARVRTLKMTLPSDKEQTKGNGRKNRWTSTEINNLKTMKDDGASNASIAETMGRSEKAIAARLKKIEKGPTDKESFKCPCGKDRIRMVFGCGHGSCGPCSSKSQTCPQCETRITVRIGLAF